MRVTIPSHLTNDELVAAVGRLTGDEREVTAWLVAHLVVIEDRALYVPAGYSSLYTYCHEALGYSEDAAYNRKAAALVARRHPVVVDMLADGRLSLTAVRLLAPVLKDDNWEAAFAEAAHKTKREVEKLAARLEPKPDVLSTVRKLPVPAAAVPERRAGGPPVLPAMAASKRPEVAPLAPQRYRVQFTMRCTERAYLEYHHAGVPFARGGGPGPGNIALHCRAHNAHEGERMFRRYLPPAIRQAREQYDAMRFAVPEREA
jgi:hypothetical protein